MHTDAQALEDNSTIECDLCIIGAGAAGITIARQFIGTNYKIALLESGGLNYDLETHALYDGKNIGLPYFSLQNARLRYFGGTTNHWGGWCAPLERIDFTKRDWVPHSGWPFSRNELDPYYIRAQEICDLGIYNYDPGFWEKPSAGIERFPLADDVVIPKIMQLSPPTRFGTAYREDIVGAPNVHLWTHANVTSIDTTEYGNEIKGLKIKCLNGKEHYARGSQYVLGCGGLENPRVLLLSNDIQKNGLGNQNDLVGRFFMEHPHLHSARLFLSAEISTEFYTSLRRTKKGLGLIGLSDQIQQEKGILNYSASLAARLESDPQRFELPEGEGILEFVENWDKRNQENLQKGVQYIQATEYTFMNRMEQAPNPDSRVTLGNEKDALGQQKIELDWRLTELDWHSIKEATLLIGQSLGEANIGRIQMLDWLRNENIEWPDFIAGGWHHMGTTRMNEDPKQGVVNAECRVHGISNLYIAGSSVYPTSGTANPTLTLVALALRLSDHLASNLSNT